MKSFIALAAVCCAVFVMAADPVNLLTEPMTISNPKTTVLENGVYSITNPAARTASILKYKLALEQPYTGPITFGVEGKSIEHKGNIGCNFGMYINLYYTDGTNLKIINFGMGQDTFDWCYKQRTYTAPKPVKEIEVIVQYTTKSAGKVAFRNPRIYLGNVPMPKAR